MQAEKLKNQKVKKKFKKWTQMIKIALYNSNKHHNSSFAAYQKLHQQNTSPSY